MSTRIFNSALEVEAAFYDALARSDLELMMSVWSEDDEVVCVPPDGGRLVGYAAVRSAWQQLFESGARLNVRVTHGVISNSMLLTVHSVFEHVAVEGDDRLAPPMIATNAYARGPHGWKMILHHASPGPELHAPDDSAAPRTVH
ncbi:MAG: YybH family protein [Rhodocyclaceae bacterium]